MHDTDPVAVVGVGVGVVVVVAGGGAGASRPMSASARSAAREHCSCECAVEGPPPWHITGGSVDRDTSERYSPWLRCNMYNGTFTYTQ